MLRPAEERGVSEHLKVKFKFKVGHKLTHRWEYCLGDQKEKKEENSSLKCVLPMMIRQNSKNTLGSICSIGNNWLKKCTWNQRAIPSGRTQGVSPLILSHGQVSPQGRCQSFFVAIIELAVLVCCWLRAKEQSQSKHRHRQLLFTISSAIVTGPPSGE